MRQFSGPPGPVGAVCNHTISVNLAVSNYDRCGFITAPFCPNISITQRTRIAAFVVAQFIARLQTSSFLKLTPMGGCFIITISVNLAVSNYDRCGFITAPFCPNISITQRTRIAAFVVAQFIAPLFFEYKRRNELRDYKRVLSLN